MKDRKEGKWEGSNGDGEAGRGQQGGGDREEGNREEMGREMKEVSQAHGMGGERLQIFLPCLPVHRRVPQLVYTNKIGDCLFIYLSVRL